MASQPEDLRHLPAAPREAGGVLPDEHPEFAPALAQTWFDTYREGPHWHAAPVETAYRHSFAFARCNRQLAYLMTGTPEAEQSLADHWRMYLGQIAHRDWQDALEKLYPTRVLFEVEVASPIGQGHADAVIYDGEITTGGLLNGTLPPVDCVLELKTINGFGFKRATGMQGEAEGPKIAHKIQAALNAFALGARRTKVVYLSMEIAGEDVAKKILGRELTPDEAWRRFAVEWTLDEFTIARLAKAEIARVADIMAELQVGVTPDEVPRLLRTDETPRGAVFSNPTAKKGAGQWVVRDEAGNITQTGTHFACGYCGFRDRCVEAGE